MPELIEVTGFVDDPWKYLERAKVVVAPLRFGAGIQNKILEAMALQKAVVITSKVARAIVGEDGVHFLIADEPEHMAGKIMSLMQNKALRGELGCNAKELIKTHYRWHIIGEKPFSSVDEVLMNTIIS